MANIAHQTRERLDVWLMKKYPDFSRSFLQKLCSDDKVLVDGVAEKSGYKLKGGEKIKVLHDMTQIIGITPDIELPVIYEDNNVIVVNKPAGVLSHGLSNFLGEPSVASFLRQRLKAKPSKTWKAEDLRFGIVHRLDRVTSGVMICAKNQETMRLLQRQFHDRKVKKTYTAVVSGEPKLSEAVLDWPLERNPKAPATFRVGSNGKAAQTKYKVLKSNGKHALLELEPKTGRTHQLRVHLKHLKHPIVGDMLYGGEASDRLYLHANKLEVELPTGKKHVFEASVPKEFQRIFNA